MPDTKIIAVVGATGAQGGGLVRAILADPRGGFSVRAITRDPSSPKAQELARLGAEVVAADVDDEDSLAKAFAGAYGAFCVTFFWEHMSAEREKAEARRMANAAAGAGLRHVIWSSFEDTRESIPLSDPRMPTLQGQYKVPHFDGKAEADRYFLDAGVPTTVLLTTYYWENLINFGGPKRGPDGVLTITLPMGDKKLAGIASEDIGKCAYGIFKAGSTYIGRTIGIAGEHLTVSAMAQSLTKALGQPVRYNPVPPDVFRSFGFPGADEAGNMFQFYADCETQFLARRSLDQVRTINPDLQTFDEWLGKNASRIPLD